MGGTQRPCDVVVLSVGGNDALGHIHLLKDRTERRFVDFALTLADIQEAFRLDYAAVLEAAGRQASAVLVLTIYRPRFHHDGLPAEMQRAGDRLLPIFNADPAGARGSIAPPSVAPSSPPTLWPITGPVRCAPEAA